MWLLLYYTEQIITYGDDGLSYNIRFRIFAQSLRLPALPIDDRYFCEYSKAN